MLWLVSAGCCALSAATFLAVFALWRMLPNKAHDRQARVATAAPPPYREVRLRRSWLSCTRKTKFHVRLSRLQPLLCRPMRKLK